MRRYVDVPTLVLMALISCGGGPLDAALEEARLGPAVFQWTCQDLPPEDLGAALVCMIEARQGLANDCRDVVRHCSDGAHRYVQACSGALKAGQTRTVTLPHERFSPPVYVDSVCSKTTFEDTSFKSTAASMYGWDAIDGVSPGGKIDRFKWLCQAETCRLKTSWHGFDSRLDATVCADGVTVKTIQKSVTFNGKSMVADTMTLMRAVFLELHADGWTLGEAVQTHIETGEAVVLPFYKGPFEVRFFGMDNREGQQVAGISNVYEGGCP